MLTTGDSKKPLVLTEVSLCQENQYIDHLNTQMNSLYFTEGTKYHLRQM